MKITLNHISHLRAVYARCIDKYFEILDRKEGNGRAQALKQQAEFNRDLDEQITNSINQYAQQTISDHKPADISAHGEHGSILSKVKKKNRMLQNLVHPRIKSA